MKTLPLAILLIAALPRLGNACSCLPPPPVESRIAEADVAFVGILTEESETENEHRRRQTFQVVAALKDQLPDTIELLNPADSALCGYSFHKGEKYAIFADLRKNGELWTSLCHGNIDLRRNNSESKAILERVRLDPDTD